MANKPESFSQYEIRREKISPEVIESWVRYIQDETYERADNAGKQIAKDNTHTTVQVYCAKHELNYRGNGYIVVKTMCSYTAFVIIALFSRSSDAKETFEAYAKSKNVSIRDRPIVLYNKRKWATREIEV